MNKKILAGALAGIGALSLMAGLGACADGETGHDFSDKWTTDEKFHWHICQDEDCDQKGSLEAHKWDGGTETEPATCDKAGLKTYECTVCHETKTEEITKLTHDWKEVEGTRVDSTCTVKGSAKYKCSLCLTEETWELELANHTLTVDVLGDEYFCAYKKCEVCGGEFGKRAHSYQFASGKITCKDCTHEETEVTSVGTLPEPLALNIADNSYRVILNESDHFEDINGYYVGYYSFTPDKSVRITYSVEEEANGGFSIGYYEEGLGGIKNFVPAELDEETESGIYTAVAELTGGREYIISVKAEKLHGAYLKFNLSVHEHEYDLGKWETDEGAHWRKATCHEGVPPKDYAVHNYVNMFCEVCGASQSVEPTANLEYHDFNETNLTASVWRLKDGADDTAIVIPAQIEKDGKIYTVNKIRSNAFANNLNIVSIVIPGTVKEIENNAFSGCNSLNTLYVDSVEAWLNVNLAAAKSHPLNAKGGRIVAAGQELTDPDITVSKDIGKYAFYKCTSLQTLKITVAAEAAGEGVKLGSYAFAYCSNLESVDLDDNITDLSTAFSNCSSLKSITIPSKVTALESSAFQSCSELGYVVIMNNGQTDLDIMCFDGCNNITKAYFYGTQEQWNNSGAWIDEYDFGDGLPSTTAVYYYSETSLSGAWHLVDGKPEIWE